MVEAMIGPAGGDVGRMTIPRTSEVGRVGLRRVAASGALAAAGPIIASPLELYVFYFLSKFRADWYTFAGVMPVAVCTTRLDFEPLNLDFEFRAYRSSPV